MLLCNFLSCRSNVFRISETQKSGNINFSHVLVFFKCELVYIDNFDVQNLWQWKIATCVLTKGSESMVPKIDIKFIYLEAASALSLLP